MKIFKIVSFFRQMTFFVDMSCFGEWLVNELPMSDATTSTPCHFTDVGQNGVGVSWLAAIVVPCTKHVEDTMPSTQLCATIGLKELISNF